MTIWPLQPLSSNNSNITIKDFADKHNEIITGLNIVQANTSTIGETNTTFNASNILSKVKTVDSINSGLDADLIDTRNNTYFTSNNYIQIQKGIVEGELAANTTESVLLTRLKTVDGNTSGLDADLIGGKDPTTQGMYGLVQVTQRKKYTNLLVNTAFAIDQSYFNITTTTSGRYFADQWINSSVLTTGAYEIYRSTASNSPFGGGGNLNILCTTTDSGTTSSEYFLFRQYIESHRMREVFVANGSLFVRFTCNANNPGTYSVALMIPGTVITMVKNFTITSGMVNQWNTFVIQFDDVGGTYLKDAYDISDPTKWALGLVFTFKAGSDYQVPTAGVWHDNGPALNGCYATSATSNFFAISGNEINFGEIEMFANDGTGYLPDFYCDNIYDVLEDCRRYFETSYQYTKSPATATDATECAWFGIGPSQGFLRATIPFVVSKRTIPNITFYNVTTNTANQVYWSSGVTYTNTLTSSAALDSFRLSCNPPTTSPVTGYFHWAADSRL